MKPKGYTHIDLRDLKGFVTNYDRVDINEDYAIDGRGFRVSTPGFLLQRDYGTKHRYAYPYPTTNLGTSTITVVNGVTLFDPTTSTDYDFIVAVDSANNTHVYVYDGSWIELTVVYTCQINGATSFTFTANPPVSGFSTVTTNNEAQNGVALGAGWPTGSFPGDLSFFIAVNTDVGNTAGIIGTGNTAHQVKILGANTTAGGMNWATGNHLTVYRTVGLLNASWTGSLTTTPHIRWLDNEFQRKITMFNGSVSGTQVTPNLPIIFMKRSQRAYCWPDATAADAYLTIPGSAVDSWFTESGGGLSNLWAKYGTRAVPIDISITSNFDTKNAAPTGSINLFPANSWLRIQINATGSGAPATGTYLHSYLFCTVMYDNYEESDPIAEYFLSGYQTGQGIQTVTDMYVNPASMPKNVTGVKWYSGQFALSSGLGLPAINQFRTIYPDSNFTTVKTIYFQQFNTTGLPGGDVSILYAGSEFKGRWFQLEWTYTTGNPQEGSDNIFTNLNHTLVEKRTLINSRFATKASRKQSSIVAVDTDDKTLRVSLFDGYGVHQDDNFPNVSNTNDAVPAIINLTGHGKLLGLSTSRGYVIAFKTSELEIIDLQAGGQELAPADVIAPRSIVTTPYGVFWAGSTGIYMFSATGGGIVPINDDWKNKYDGTLFTLTKATNTAFITPTYRQNIIAGYDPTYEEIWFQIQQNIDTDTPPTSEYLNYRFAPKTGKWSVRKLNLTGGGTSQLPVAFFSQHSDKSMVIGYGGGSATPSNTMNGVLLYPARDGSRPWQDDVIFADNADANGFETDATFNIGSFYSTHDLTTPWDFFFDYVGASTSGTDAVNVTIYANKETSPIDAATKTLNVQTRSLRRMMRARGPVESLRIKFQIPTGSLKNFKNFDLSNTAIGFIKIPRTGTK